MTTILSKARCRVDHFTSKARGFAALASVATLVALGDLAHAQTPAGKPPPSVFEVLQTMMPMFLIVFGIFYFLVIRPQKQEMDDQVKLINSLKKGERVITTGGILGQVVTVSDQFVTLSLEQNSKIKIEKRHIARKFENA